MSLRHVASTTLLKAEGKWKSVLFYPEKQGLPRNLDWTSTRHKSQGRVTEGQRSPGTSEAVSVLGLCLSLLDFLHPCSMRQGPQIHNLSNSVTQHTASQHLEVKFREERCLPGAAWVMATTVTRTLGCSSRPGLAHTLTPVVWKGGCWDGQGAGQLGQAGWALLPGDRRTPVRQKQQASTSYLPLGGETPRSKKPQRGTEQKEDKEQMSGPLSQVVEVFV